jgi:hypothetical protein
MKADGEKVYSEYSSIRFQEELDTLLMLPELSTFLIIKYGAVVFLHTFRLN